MNSRYGRLQWIVCTAVWNSLWVVCVFFCLSFLLSLFLFFSPCVRFIQWNTILSLAILAFEQRKFCWKSERTKQKCAHKKQFWRKKNNVEANRFLFCCTAASTYAVLFVIHEHCTLHSAHCLLFTMEVCTCYLGNNFFFFHFFKCLVLNTHKCAKMLP